MAGGMIHPNMATLHPPVAMNQSDVEYNASLPREGLAFHQVQQAVRDYEREQNARRASMHREVVPVEGQTLDLSMPKKRDSSTPQPYGAPPTAHSKDSQLKQQQQQQQQQHYRSDPMTGMRAPAPYPPRSTPPAQNNATRPLGGSIMQGTPFSPQVSLQVPRTDGLLRPAVHQGRNESMAGSITQGTPILVKDHSSPYEQAGLSYYKIPPQSSSPSPSQPGSGGGGGGGQQRGAQYSSDPQQFSSRQIILTDYLLSQQMPERNSNANSGSRRDREPPLSQQQLQRPNDRGPPQLQPGQPSLYQPYRPPSPMYLPGRGPYGMEPVHHGYPPHSGSGNSSGGHPTAPSPHLQHPPQQPTPPQQQQQRQGVIQRNSSVPSGRQSDPRPSPPAPILIHQQGGPGRTSSPSQPAATGGGATGRPGSMSYLGSVSPRGESIYGHDAFASLVNAAAAQPSLPVPDRDRRDRDKDPRPGLVSR